MLEHQLGKKLLKVVQKRTNRVATMGIVRDKCHFFFPEEGVWLMEAGQASIMFNGLPLSIQQGYNLLATSQVSFAKYFVYSYLKRAGYIVLPSHRNEELRSAAELAKPQEPSKSGEKSDLLKFPQHLLDQFPSVSTKNWDLIELHKRETFSEKFGVSPEFPVRTLSSFRTTRRPQERLRPGYWPRFDDVKTVNSWGAYRELLQKVSRRKRPATGSISTMLKPDYDVFASDGSYSHTIFPPPIFQLFVIESSRFGLPSQMELLELSARVCVSKLVIAVVEHSMVLFYDASHQPVQL